LQAPLYDEQFVHIVFQIRDSKLMELIIGIIGARDGDARIQCYLDWIQHTNPVLYDLIAMWQNDND
jgi:hypothetical protein